MVRAASMLSWSMAKKPEQRGKASAGPAKPGLSRDDTDLFHAAMEDVEPVAGAKAEPPPTAATPPTTSPAGSSRRARPAPLGAVRMPELDPGIAAGLDARTMERLRRGRIRPEGRLDLHGMIQTDAHGALTSYIEGAAAAGKRCIVVITGKGRVSEGGGVLRRQLPGWLNGPLVRPYIIGFAEAQPKDGGGGAMYVLLRRRRV